MKRFQLVTLMCGLLVSGCDEQLPRRPGTILPIVEPADPCKANPTAAACNPEPDPVPPPDNNPPQIPNPPSAPDKPLKDLFANWEDPCVPGQDFPIRTEFLFGTNGEGQYKWISYRDCGADRIDFVVTVSFTFEGGAAGIVEGSKKLDMVIKSVKMYSDDAATIAGFNEDKNCGFSDWKRSQAREVGNLDKACDLGIQIKNGTKIFNLYKVAGDSLLLGVPWIGESDESSNSGIGSELNRPVMLYQDWPFKRKK